MPKSSEQDELWCYTNYLDFKDSSEVRSADLILLFNSKNIKEPLFSIGLIN